MKLYISFNSADLQEAIALAQQVEDFCDAFEIGPVLLTKFGINAISEFRKQFPQKMLVADTNIIEFENEITELVTKAGCDWLTVLARASANTLHNTCVAAHKMGKKVMVDIFDAADAGQIAVDAKSLGVDALLVHNTDSTHPLALIDRWDMVKGNTTLPVFICTHITRLNLNVLIKLEPAGLIISKSITAAENPAEEAQYFYTIIKNQ